MNGEASARSAQENAPGLVPSAANFDIVARIYCWAEYLALGPLLKRTREEFLPELNDVHHALLLGDGDGRFARALLRKAAAAHVYAVDSSAVMLRLTHARCARDGVAGRLTLEHASVLAAVAHPHCDLIATHFLLDCLTQGEVEALAARLARQVSARARWVISEFGLPHGWLRARAARIYIRLLYFGFRILTGLRTDRLPDHAAALEAAGFMRLQRVERMGGFLYSEMWERVPDFPSSNAPATQRQSLI